MSGGCLLPLVYAIYFYDIKKQIFLVLQQWKYENLGFHQSSQEGSFDNLVKYEQFFFHLIGSEINLFFKVGI